MMIGNNSTVSLAYNSYNAVTKALEKTTRALTTGLRAATAADDASGFAIGEKLSSQVAGVDRAIRNSQDGISMLQTAEGALNEINSMLQRMRELTVQAANDTLTTQDRSYIQLEIGELRQNIDSIASNTTFNGKRLLDGSSTAMWSTDNASTKLKVTGAITAIDTYGQKKATEGNYRIDIRSKAGKAQVQKSAIFNITVAEEYEDVETITVEGTDLEPINPITNIPSRPVNEINIESGVDSLGAVSGNGWYFANNTLTITGDGTYNIVGTNTATTNKILVNEGVKASIFLTDVNIDVSTMSRTSAFDMSGASVDLYLSGTNTLTSGYDVAGILTQNIDSTGSKSALTINSASGFASEDGILNATCSSGCAAGIDGACHTSMSGTSRWQGSTGRITINGGTINATANGPGAGIGGGGYFSSYGGSGSDVNIIINGGNITATSRSTGAGIGSGGGGRNDTSNVNSIIITGGTINAAGGPGGGAAIGGGQGGNNGNIVINDSVRGNMTLSGFIDADNDQTEPIGRGAGGIYQEQEEEITEEITVKKTRIRASMLSEINAMYDPSGVFMINQPQNITITQGDGRTASVMLYSTDTMYDVAKKINDAIAQDLGQGKYTDNISKFCTIAEGIEGTSESVREEIPAYSAGAKPKLIGYTTNATMLIRSVVAGNAGRLTFTSENNDLINALGLNTIQQAEESIFTASVYDAHSRVVIASNVEADGNSLNGVIHPNISVEFDAMANTKATWNEATRSYVLSSENNAYSTTIHILDRSTSFQIGQNTGEDIYINIGDMRASSLGINGIDVSTRAKASESITVIDAALHKVNSQRSKIGSYQNELEYNANSLMEASIHLQASESRIKDADMALEMIEFVKLQILSNTSSSMLSHANQNSQAVISLFNQ